MTILSLGFTGFIPSQPLVNPAYVRIKPGPLDRRSTSVPGRLGIRRHLRDTVPADPEIPSNPTPAQPVLKVSVTNLQIQIHGEYPQALPKIEKAKVADFYAARDNTMPPLPWSSIASPFTLGMRADIGPTVLTEWRFAFSGAGLSFPGLKDYKLI